MIHLKTPKELALMKEGGSYLKKILQSLVKEARIGVTPKEIEEYACELIAKTGGEPSFKRVPGYHWATCVNVNDVVVHGIPDGQPFEDGDVIGIDVGLFYKGFHTDTSWTLYIPSKDQTDKGDREKKIRRFLQAGEKAVEKGIEQVKVGNRIGHISEAMEKVVEGSEYCVIEELVGHGIGRDLHEDPEVPGVLFKPVNKTRLIEPGLAIAIEIIYTPGNSQIVMDDDNWTLRTKDGTISGLFEKTVIVEDHGGFVVT